MELQPFQVEWIQLAETHRNLTIQASVGSGKSTALGLVFLLRSVVFDRRRRWIYASESERVPKAAVSLLGDTLRYNRKVVDDFGRFYDPSLVWTRTELMVLGHDPTSKDANFVAVGRGGSIEGFRANGGAFFDDPWALKTEISAAEQQFNRLWWLNQIIPRVEPGGKVIAIGAPWFKEDSWDWVCRLPAMQGNVRRYPMVLADGTILWAGKYTVEILEQMKVDMTPDVFSARVLLNPSSLEGDMFKRPWIKYWRDDEMPSRAQIFAAMGVDLAAGKETSRSQSVVSVVGRDLRTKKILVLAQFAAPLNLDLPSFFKEVARLNDQWHPEAAVAIEDAGQQWEVARAYLPIVPNMVPQAPTEGTSVPQKLRRIQGTLQSLVYNGTLLFHESQNEGLVFCLLRLPNALLIDPADSLEIAVRRLLIAEKSRDGGSTNAGPPLAVRGPRPPPKPFDPQPTLKADRPPWK